MNLYFVAQDSRNSGSLAGLDPRTKMIAFSILIAVICLTPPTSFLKFGLYFVLLLILVVWSRISVLSILLRLTLVGSLIVFIVLLVFLFQRQPLLDNLLIVWNLCAKTLLIVISISVLTLTTEFYHLINGLELFRVPGIFISLLAFSYRYLQLLYDEALRVKRAVDSRSFKKRSFIEKVSLLRGALAHVFLRTFERSGRIYAAMLSRGYDGRFPMLNSLSFKISDALFFFFFTLYLLSVWVAG